MNRIAFVMSFGLLTVPAFATTARCADLIETYDIAEEAYTYAFPMIVSYKAMYQFFIDKASSQYKGPLNQLFNEARVFTPKDTASSRRTATRPIPSSAWTCAPSRW